MASYYAGSTLSAEQVAAHLYQAGFRGEQLVQLVAVGKRESGYVTGAHRTDSARSSLSGDRGLFQINYIWDNQLMAAGIIRNKSDLFDPATNARAAKYIYDRQGIAAWNMSKGGWSQATDINAARAAVNNATQQGLLSADWASGGGSAPGQPAGGAASGPTVLPDDAKVISDGSNAWALFYLGGSTWVSYLIDSSVSTAGHGVERMSAQQVHQYFNPVNGGYASELKNVKSTHGTYGNFWNSIVTQVIGSHNPAANDDGVRRVLAEFAGRPDMSEAELQNKLKATTYWQTKTEGELAFNSLSPAEQALRRQDVLSRMQATAEQLVGRPLDRSQIDGGYVEMIASGRMGFGEWTERHMKPYALMIPESPYARQRREEEEATRQRPIDIENTANQVRQTLDRWGIRWSEGSIMQWGKDIVEKIKSDKDLLDSIKQQAQTLYPTKPPDIETKEWASPYLETFTRVMEEEGDLFSPDIGRALSQGVNVWDFEMGLKKSSKWLNTRNAREELFSVASEVGQRLGFS